MKIRHDLVFISSLLFTICFVWMIPWEWANALPGTGHYNLEAPWREVIRLYGEVARLSLTMILIGLIVVWTGYLKKLRWTWFIMFVIVFGWAFPIYIWHDILRPAFIMPASDWHAILASAARGDRVGRAFFEEMFLFSLMIVALFLPVKPFFFGVRK
jgi:hypothetical protein